MTLFRKFTVLAFALTLSISGLSDVQALTVSPVKIELQGDPGQTLTADFRLLNEQDKTLNFYGSVANFEAEGESGTPNFVSNDTDLASWIHLNPGEEGEDPTVITLNSKEEITRTFTVDIPGDATPGGHFAALFWATNPASETEGVAVGAKVGILVFLSVNGDFDQGGDLLSFDTTDAQRFFTSLPITFEYRFQNTGADRVVPEGTLELKNTLGWTAEVLTVNGGQNNVLPASIRKFEETWGTVDETLNSGFWSQVQKEWEDFAMGYYSATLNLTYGPDESLATSALNFWIFPWELLTVLVLGFLIALSLFVTLIRRYNRWIIQSALAAQKKPVRSTKPAKRKPSTHKRK
jgi:hypothetical protein